jgi:hypothetical protein
MGVVHSLEDGQDPTSEVINGRNGPPDPGPMVIVEPPDGRIPYQPAAAARRKQLLADTFTPTKIEHIDPHARSAPDGVPRINYYPVDCSSAGPRGPAILLESNHVSRHPPGRTSALGKDIKLFMGDSRGRWEGNTLVVDVTSTRAWDDSMGPSTATPCTSSNADHGRA